MTQHCYRRQLARVLATVLFVASLALPAFSGPGASALEAGVSNITLGTEGKGERGPVRFPHDRHTLTVTDCAVCHTNLAADTAPFAFAPQSGPKKGVSRQDVMHGNCTACHETQQRGPLQAQCTDCHMPPPTSATAMELPRFDRSLHTRHIASPFVVDPALADSPVRGENCALCHHPLPQAAAAEEGSQSATSADTAPLRESCRTCHAAGDGASTGTPAATTSFRTVGHETCVLCHQTTLKAGKVSGPVQCAGCHDAAVFAGYQRLNPVPPLQAGQPVAVTLQSFDKPTMPVVLFNHRLHENSLPSCASCHHKTVQACSTCHTPGGDVKGGNVPLSAAMHNAQAANTCVGCHEQRQLSQPECAGCHALRQTGSVAENCAFCHRPAVSPAEPTATTPVASPEAPVQAPPALPAVPAYPETVRIGGLSSEFQPSELPHGRIVRALQRGIAAAEPSLALRHDSTALCAACHHKAAVSTAPPACVTCHVSTPGPVRPNTPPSLRLAYHQQCMGCHERMHISTPANTDCAGCHAPVEQRTAE